MSANHSPTPQRSLRGIFGEARTQILLWYAGLFLLLGLLAIPAFRWILFRRVEARVREDLVEQVDDFRELLEAENRNVPVAVDRFLAETMPEDDNYFILFLDDRFYDAIPRALPAELQPGGELLQEILQQQQQQQQQIVLGSQSSNNPAIQELIYIVKPIQSAEGEVMGTFVGAHAAAGERQEAIESTESLVEVIFIATLAAFLLSWLLSGRVLKPIRALTATAREIGEAGLSQRLEESGRGEMADLAQTFNAMLDRLQKIITSQRHFISDASHELRTPITIVRGHLELMGDDPDDRQEAVAIALDELERLERMVEEMSLLTKAERPDFVRPTLVGLTDFTASLFAKAKTLGERNWQLAATADETAWIDPQRMTEAIMNLVQNAVEHSQPEDTIAIGSAVDASNVKFWVRDTGAGIAPENQQRIFERFVRIGKPTAQASGAGLGLAIVEAIAEAHGGSIALDSQLGRGATFTLIVPRVRQNRSSLIRGAQP